MILGGLALMATGAVFALQFDRNRSGLLAVMAAAGGAFGFALLTLGLEDVLPGPRPRALLLGGVGASVALRFGLTVTGLGEKMSFKEVSARVGATVAVTLLGVSFVPIAADMAGALGRSIAVFGTIGLATAILNPDLGR